MMLIEKSHKFTLLPAAETFSVGEIGLSGRGHYCGWKKTRVTLKAVDPNRLQDNPYRFTVLPSGRIRCFRAAPPHYVPDRDPR